MDAINTHKHIYGYPNDKAIEILQQVNKVWKEQVSHCIQEELKQYINCPTASWSTECRKVLQAKRTEAFNESGSVDYFYIEDYITIHET